MEVSACPSEVLAMVKEAQRQLRAAVERASALMTSASLAVVAMGERLVEAATHEDTLREQIASREKALSTRVGAVCLHEAAAAQLEKLVAYRERAASVREDMLIACEGGLCICEEENQRETSALEAERQRQEKMAQGESSCRSEHTQELRALLIRARAVLIGLDGEVPKLSEEVEDDWCLQVFQEVARDLDALPKALEDVINERNRSLLCEVATRLFSNVHLAAPTIDLRALITDVPSEAPKSLALEVRGHVDTLVKDLCGSVNGEEVV